ncbi:MAG TPA: hypothetical protein VKA08_10780 [Balneolales bacterium]|nr:hypothetical protein [Balneolales bacterium]
MNKYLKNSCWWSLLVGLLMMVGGCNVTNNNSQPGAKPVNVYMQTKTSGTTYSNPYGLSEVPGTAAVDSTLKLTSVSMFVKKLRLKSITEDSLDFQQQNLVVDLPLGKDSVQISTKAVPQGSYDGLSLHVGKPAYADSSKYPDFVAGPSEHQRYSMIISGTYKGKSFTYKVHHEFEFELKLNPPLVISDSTVSVDVNLLVDTSKWFVNKETGATLDPTNPDDLEQIVENIDSSFEAHRREHEREDNHNSNHDSGSGSGNNSDGGSGN